MATKTKTIGNILEAARTSAGLTQRELATKMGYSNPQFISNWERDRCGLPHKKAALFCKITGMKTADMRKILTDAAADKVGKLLK